MNSPQSIAALALIGATACLPRAALAQHGLERFARRADAIVDLNTVEGVRLVRGQWRYSEAQIVAAESRAPGADLKPSGAPIKSFDVVPKAGAADFDDAAWSILDPPALDARRSTAKLCFNWYRLKLTIPERVGDFATAGSTVVFEVVVDDYAEIWVDGRLPRTLGSSGGPLVGGFNVPNRVVIASDARPGQQIQLAVFGINGPLSEPPNNFIWIRSATLDFYREGPRDRPQLAGEVVRHDPALDTIVAPGARLEKLAGGFQFIEGPVWHPDGYLLFSDPNENTIYGWMPDGRVFVYRAKSGYSGADIGLFGQPGSNGLTLDAEGRLTICEHGNRRVTRQERNGSITVLADRVDGQRLNSPNDLVYKSDGTLCFSDPPFGLPKFHDDPRRELPYSGVFCVKNGTVRTVSRELSGPNGVAFSPDERYLYVTNWDLKKKVVMRYPVQADGAFGPGSVFFDMTGAAGEEALDGIKVDEAGNLYVSGPGGVWILSPAGAHLGTIVGPELPANFAWGDADGRTLYLTARTGLYRIRLKVPGVRPGMKAEI